MGKWKKVPAELVERFDLVIAGFPDAERKQMFGCPCAFLNSNLWTGLHEASWLIRLSEPDRLEFETEFGAQPFAPMGRAMKEYRLIPEKVMQSEDLFQVWLEKSYHFVSSMPPKQKKN